MTAIKEIAPILVVIACIAPVIAGYRKNKLGKSILIGWRLIVLAFFTIDFLIPELSERFSGREAGLTVTPKVNGTIEMIFLGWVSPLILHPVGYFLRELVDAIRGLLSKSRRS